ncbi:peptidylprolyl isomerase [Corallibacter vietnamensis]|uniref:Peptidylprolyl isomerase n=1 Tax=Corallibacter vietnamensis TaxID=904130 RepID=A0ABP7HA68_9FLAO
MVKYFFAFVFLATFYLGNAQVKKSEVLFSVNESPVYVNEFVRIFNKNIDLVKDESQKDVDEYLKLFINYKLKLKEAETLKLDEKSSYKIELQSYKKQLAKNYLTDNKVTDALVREAYNRIKQEVKASHILIRLDEAAKPEDTIKAYNQLLELRERVKNEGFDKVKQDVHNGRTVYAEDLGYFNGFKMVYKFENAAYNTNVGDISMPFKTRFGYHIVQVFDKRESRGERTVGHIMISNKKDPKLESSETRINDIYAKLKQGEAFESLAKQFSEDASSAKVGGKLAPFSGGQLSSSEFEDAAFALKNVGDVSKPIQSAFGWHIIKLYDIKPVPSFDEMKSELEVKVKRDSRSQIINTSIVNDLKEHYKIPSQKPEGLTYFEHILTNDYYNGTWSLPENFKATEQLAVINDKKITNADFGNYLLKTQQRSKPVEPLNKIIAEKYDAFLGQELIQYREENLENENEDYANIVSEYRDGLLLFDLMETQIWNTSKTDSLGIQEYYNAHKEDYYWNKRADAVVASSADKKTIKKVAKLLKKGESPETIKESLNTNGKVNVIFTSEIMDKEHQALPKTFEFKEGLSGIYKHNNAFSIVKVNKVLPRTLKTFDEAKGNIISDYQSYKEALWLDGLHKKYQVTINESVLEKVKTQINKQ